MKRFYTLTSIFTALLLAVASRSGLTTVPNKVNVQGVLRDSLGAPISGTVNLTFKVYSLETGVPALLYMKNQSGVSVAGGLFNLLLGDFGSIPDSAWTHSPLELGIAVNGEPELTPRLRLGSVPSARAASRISGDLETRPGTLDLSRVNSGSTDSISITTGGGSEIKVFTETAIASNQASLKTTPTSASIAIGDLTGDGLVDITATHDSATLRGGGTLTYKWAQISGPTSARMAIGDLTGDGRADIVATHDSTRLSIQNNGSSDSGGVDIMTNDSSATFNLQSKFVPTADAGLAQITATSRGARFKVSVSNGTDRGAPSIAATSDSGGSIAIEEKGMQRILIKANNGSSNVVLLGDDNHDLKMQADSTGGGSIVLGRFSRGIALYEISHSAGYKAINDSGVHVADMDGDGDGARFVLRSGTVGGSSRVTLDTKGAVGKIGINTETPSEALHVVGNICATGTIGACSDVRFKKSITPIKGALDKVEQLRGVSYQWNRKRYPQFAEGNQIGFVAQEIQEVVPEVVSEGSDGMLSVDYGRLSAVLLEAVKEQQKEIKELRKEIDMLKRNSSK